MKYAKMTDGNISYCPNPITIDGKDIFATDPTPYGYKPVIIPEAPVKEGFYAEFDGYEETDTEIIQKWRLEPVPEPDADEEDYKAALNELGVSVYEKV